MSKINAQEKSDITFLCSRTLQKMGSNVSCVVDDASTSVELNQAPQTATIAAGTKQNQQFACAHAYEKTPDGKANYGKALGKFCVPVRFARYSEFYIVKADTTKPASIEE